MLVGKACLLHLTDKRARKETFVMLEHFLWCVYTNTKENMTFQEGLMLLIMRGSPCWQTYSHSHSPANSFKINWLC